MTDSTTELLQSCRRGCWRSSHNGVHTATMSSSSEPPSALTPWRTWRSWSRQGPPSALTPWRTWRSWSRQGPPSALTPWRTWRSWSRQGPTSALTPWRTWRSWSRQGPPGGRPYPPGGGGTLSGRWSPPRLRDTCLSLLSLTVTSRWSSAAPFLFCPLK